MADIYQPIYLMPDNDALDMTEDQVFSCEINGDEVTSYTITIYDDAESTVYTDTESLSPSLYNGDILEITIPADSCTNGNEYTWILSYTDGVNTKISLETPFSASSTPILTITVPDTITTFGYEFVGSYSQDEGVDIKSWHFEVYDDDDEVVLSTDLSYSANIKHTFRGFENGESYSIKGFGISQNNQEFESPLYEFNIDYSEDKPPVNLEVEEDSDTTSIIINIPELIIQGDTSGTYSYVENFIESGNYGLQLDTSSILDYTTTIPDNFNIRVLINLDATFDGNIIRLVTSPSEDNYIVFYDNANERFGYTIDGVTNYKEGYNISSSYLYLLVLLPDDLTIKIYNIPT